MNELAKRGHGGVGSDLTPKYAGVADGSNVTKASYVSLNITDAKAVNEVIPEVDPDVIAHYVAQTVADMVEDDDKVAAIHKVNVDETQNVANVAKKLGASIVYLSTGYASDGQGITPWEPDLKGYKPLNAYGETKFDGEEAVANALDKHFIVGIARVFGVNDSNFIKTMLKVGPNRDEARVVSDRIGTPTYTFDSVRLSVDMIETDKYGYYHATNSKLPATEGGYDKNGTKIGYIFWYDFTREIYHQAGYKTKVTPVTTEEYGLSKAVRPFNSRLDKSKLEKDGFKPLPTWTDTISRYLDISKDDGFFGESKRQTSLIE